MVGILACFYILIFYQKACLFLYYVIDVVIFWLCTWHSSQNFFGFLEHYSILCPLKQSIQSKSYYVHIMQFQNSIRTTLIRILHIIKYPFLFPYLSFRMMMMPGSYFCMMVLSHACTRINFYKT